MTIKRLGEADLEGLLNLYKFLHENDDPPPASGVAKRIWQGITADDLFVYYGIVQDDELVSSCALSIIPNLTRGAKPYGVIENVVTHPDHRGRGHAKRLLRHSLEYAWERGCYKVMLLSSVHRDVAHQLYEDVGFSRKAKIGFVAKPTS